jgi:hypothetical protein
MSSSLREAPFDNKVTGTEIYRRPCGKAWTRYRKNKRRIPLRSFFQFWDFGLAMFDLELEAPTPDEVIRLVISSNKKT